MPAFLKFKGIFDDDDEGDKKHARYVYAKECDGCFSPELACYWASLSFHGEGAPSRGSFFPPVGLDFPPGIRLL